MVRLPYISYIEIEWFFLVVSSSTEHCDKEVENEGIHTYPVVYSLWGSRYDNTTYDGIHTLSGVQTPRGLTMSCWPLRYPHRHWIGTRARATLELICTGETLGRGMDLGPGLPCVLHGC